MADAVATHPVTVAPLIRGNKSAADVTRDVCGALDAKPTRPVVAWPRAFILGADAGRRGRLLSDRHGDRHLGIEQHRRVGV